MGDGLRLLASGFDALEGPTVDDAGNLFVSEVKRGGVLRISPNGRTEVLIPERVGIGGICLHDDGGLVVSGPDLAHVQHNASRVLLELAEVPTKPGTDVIGLNDI